MIREKGIPVRGNCSKHNDGVRGEEELKNWGVRQGLHPEELKYDSKEFGGWASGAGRRFETGLT